MAIDHQFRFYVHKLDKTREGTKGYEGSRLRIYSIHLRDVGYHIDVDDDGRVVHSSSFPLSWVFGRDSVKKMMFADKLGKLLGDLSEPRAVR